MVYTATEASESRARWRSRRADAVRRVRLISVFAARYRRLVVHISYSNQYESTAYAFVSVLTAYSRVQIVYSRLVFRDQMSRLTSVACTRAQHVCRFREVILHDTV